MKNSGIETELLLRVSAGSGRRVGVHVFIAGALVLLCAGAAWGSYGFLFQKIQYEVPWGNYFAWWDAAGTEAFPNKISDTVNKDGGFEINRARCKAWSDNGMWHNDGTKLLYWTYGQDRGVNDSSGSAFLFLTWDSGNDHDWGENNDLNINVLNGITYRGTYINRTQYEIRDGDGQHWTGYYYGWFTVTNGHYIVTNATGDVYDDNFNGSWSGLPNHEGRKLVKRGGSRLIMMRQNGFAQGLFIDAGSAYLQDHDQAAGTGGIWLGPESGGADTELTVKSARTIANAITARPQQGYKSILKKDGTGDVTLSGKLTLASDENGGGRITIVSNTASGALTLTGGIDLNGASADNRAIIAFNPINLSATCYVTNATNKGLVLRGPGPVTFNGTNYVNIYQDEGTNVIGSTAVFPVAGTVYQLGTRNNADYVTKNAYLTFGTGDRTYELSAYAGFYDTGGTPGIRQFTFSHGANTITLKGVVDLGSVSGYYLNLSNAQPVIIEGTLSGSSGINKIGAGLLTLSGNASYGGRTRVENGSLKLGSTTAAGAAIDLGHNATANSVAVYVVDGKNLTTPVIVTNGTGERIIGMDAAGTATLDANVTLYKAVTLTNPASSTITIADGTEKITGGFGVEKKGAGTVVIAGPNDYSGGTTISAGTLKIGAGGTTGSIVGNVTDNAALVFGRSNDYAFSGVISGSGTVAQEGAGTLTLNQANSFGGGLTVRTGTVSATTSANALGGSGTGAVKLGDAGCNANVVLQGDGNTFANPISIEAGTGGTKTIRNNSGTTLISGGVTLNAPARLVSGATALTILTGALSGGGNLTIARDAGSGQVRLDVVSAGFTGDVGIESGVLRLDRANCLSSVNAVSMVAGTTLDFRAGNTIEMLSGAGTVTKGVSGGSTLTVSPGNGVSGEFSGTIQDGSGAVSIVKDGLGAWTLSGNDTYGGNTTLSGGTLSAATYASALGAGSLLLSGANATLRLLNDSGLNFGRNTTVSAPMAIASGRLNGGAGVTHALGALFLNASTLTVSVGPACSDNQAGLSFGATTLSANGAVFQTDNGVNLSIGALGGNFSWTKQGSGILTMTAAGTGSHASRDAALNGGLTVVQHGDAFGTGSGASDVAINDTAILELNGSGLALNNDQLVYLNNGGTIRSAGNNSTSAKITAGNGAAATLAAVQSGDVFGIGNGNNDLTGGNAATVLHVAGAGTVLLRQSSDYAGNWTLDAGTLLLQSSANALGQTPARSLTLHGGTLQAQYDSSPGLDYTGGPGNNVVVDASSTVIADRETDGIGRTFVFGGLGIGAQTLSIAKGAHVTSGTAAVTFGNATLSGAATLDVAGGAKLTLANVVNGNHLLTVQGAGNAEITGGIGAGAGGVKKDGAGTLTLAGPNGFTGLLDIDGGTVSVGAGGTAGGVVANVANDGALVFNRSDASEYAGAISGGGTLTKLGAGALTLSGASPAFNGATTVSVGQLIVSGTLANSAVTVLNNAAAKGAGTVGTLAVNTGGTVAPGNSDVLRGGLAVASLAFQNGSKFRVKIGDVAGEGVERTDRDYIANNGACSLAGTTTIQLDSSQTANWITSTDHVWTVIAGGISSTNGFALDASTYCTLSPGAGGFTLAADSGNLQVIYDDDVAAPLTNNVNLPGAAAAPFVVATNGTAPADAIRGFISRRTGSGTNIVTAVTDAELARAGDLALQFVLGARDVNSGVARGTAGTTNTVMSLSFGDVVVGNYANYNAGLSTVQTTTNQFLTNFWTFANGDFAGATITSLMAANQPVCMRVPDTDNDRPNDRAILSDQQVGYLRVADDDAKGPIISALAVEGASGGTAYFESFEPATGWTNSLSFSGEWTFAGSNGTYVAVGDVLWGSLDPKVTGTRRIGLLGTGTETITSLQLPPRLDPGILTLMAGRFGAEGAENDVQIRMDWLDGAAWTSLGTRTVTNRNPEFEMFTWNVNLAGAVTLRLVRVATTGPQVYVDDVNVMPESEWLSTNQLKIGWSPAVDDYSGVDEYRLVIPGTNAAAPAAATDGELTYGGSATNAVVDIDNPARQGVLTGYLFANDDDNDRIGDRAMGNVRPIVVKVDRTRPTAVPGLQSSNDEVDDPSTQFDLEWTTTGVGPDDPTSSEHPTHQGADVAILSPWSTYKIYFGPWDPPEQGGREYVATHFIANQFYTNWPAVTCASSIEDETAQAYQPDYGDLRAVGTGQIRLYDLEPGQDYVIVLVGVDVAGNEGRPGPTSWVTNDTIRFSIIRSRNIPKCEAETKFPDAPSLANTECGTAAALYWIAAGTTNGQGEYTLVKKDYDLLCWDASRFQESTDTVWNLIGTVRTNWFVDDGGHHRPRGQLRFYRASYKDRWRAVNTNTLLPQRPLASEEIYAVHNVILSGGQNFVALHGVPFTNTFAGVFGGTENFPGGPSALPAAGATIVEFYAPGTNAVSCEQYFLNTSGRWLEVGGGDVTDVPQDPDFFTRGFSITLPDTLPEAYAETTALDNNQQDESGNPLAVPAKYWEPLLQVPTNAFSQVICTGCGSGRVKTNVYNLAALRLPVAAHPSEMRLLECGFAKGPRGTGDEIYTINTATKSMLTGSTLYCDANGVWRFVGNDGLVPWGYFKPNDVLVIVSRNRVGSGFWTWTYHPTNFFRLPTRWMGY